MPMNKPQYKITIMVQIQQIQLVNKICGIHGRQWSGGGGWGRKVWFTMTDGDD